MQNSILVLVVGVLTAHSVLSATFHEIAEACNKEIGFTGDVEKLDYKDPAIPKEAKCAVACVFEKKGVFKPDGSIDREKEREIPKELIKDEELLKKYMKAIDECDVSAKSNKCDTAFEYIRCIKTKVGPM